MPGFTVNSGDVDYEIDLKIRYKDGAKADEVLTALSQAYAKAFGEIDSRLGPVKVE